MSAIEEELTIVLSRLQFADWSLAAMLFFFVGLYSPLSPPPPLLTFTPLLHSHNDILFIHKFVLEKECYEN